jgi:rhodanese-related sulfurtransferase
MPQPQQLPYPPPRSALAARLRILALMVVSAFFFTASCVNPPRDQTEKKEAAYAMYQEYAKDFPDVRDISSETLLGDANAVFIDVRPPEERAVSMIKGAISAKDFLDDPGAYPNKELVAYCTIGYRSGEFAEAMRKRGLAIKNLQAGILGWLHAGGEIDGPDGKPVRKVHVYGEKWNLAPDGYATVW